MLERDGLTARLLQFVCQFFAQRYQVVADALAAAPAAGRPFLAGQVVSAVNEGGVGEVPEAGHGDAAGLPQFPPALCRHERFDVAGETCGACTTYGNI